MDVEPEQGVEHMIQAVDVVLLCHVCILQEADVCPARRGAVLGVAEQMQQPCWKEDELGRHQLRLYVLGAEKDDQQPHLTTQLDGLDGAGCFAGANVAAEGAVHVSANDLDVDGNLIDEARVGGGRQDGVRQRIALAGGLHGESGLVQSRLPQAHQLVVVYRSTLHVNWHRFDDVVLVLGSGRLDDLRGEQISDIHSRA